jgi:Rrf2 family protein
MRISAKGRYALAAVVDMAQNSSKGQHTTVISISERLGISKIYLEQVFSLLKKDGIVSSIKGAQGGYQLKHAAKQLSVADVLSAVEPLLFEETKESVKEKAPDIENAMHICAFQVMDEALHKAMESVTIQMLIEAANEYKEGQNYMYYI